MKEEVLYDVAIAGGGLAGLALSIQLAKQGYRVILFEKESYPFHRVCGEYISNESWTFLESLGLDLESMELPKISRLQLSASNGKLLKQDLLPGGFGISRFKLDQTLAELAKKNGVELKEETKINEIRFENDHFILYDHHLQYRTRVACGCFGKRSNLDIKWKRRFTLDSRDKNNNYVGIKYHVRSAFPPDTIALHLFEHGYAGIVKIEGDLYNLCYLTTAANLQKSQGNIGLMEKEILSPNPHLLQFFLESQRCATEPVTISQISFAPKSQVEDHVLMVGDAAGMITPLCGNGMSMALHASKLAATQILLFLKEAISREEMEKRYQANWNLQFSNRLRAGRMIQRLFWHPRLILLIIRLAGNFPSITKWLIKQTHGKPY